MKVYKNICSKTLNFLYCFECNVCNLGYVGLCFTNLNAKVNIDRNDMKNLRNKNTYIETNYFQLHDFNIFAYY